MTNQSCIPSKLSQSTDRDRELLTGNFTSFSSKGLTLHGKICKRAEIHSVNYPKFGGSGPLGQVNKDISWYF